MRSASPGTAGRSDQGIRPGYDSMASRYDDGRWGLVPADPGPPPAHLARFVRGLGRVERALDVGCGDGRLTAELDAARLTAADVSAVAHVRAVQLFLSEMRRVLRPGGELALTTPAAPPLGRPEDPLSPHLRRFTRRSLRRVLGGPGFLVRSLERRSGALLTRATR